MNEKIPTPEEIKKITNKTPEELLSKLKPEDQKKVQNILANEELTKKMLNSPQAKMLMKLLNKDKGGK